MRTGIRVRDGGSYVPKEDIFKQISNTYRASILCIEDPLNSGNSEETFILQLKINNDIF